MPSRVSPLADIALQGSFGAATAAPGVTFSVRHPLSIITIIARKGKASALSAAMERQYGIACPSLGRSATSERLTLHWCGAEQWYAIAGDREEGALYRDLKTSLAGLASCSDQSHGRIVIAISGPKARKVLAKGTPVDLHSSVFNPGQCAVTQMAHVGVHLAQTGEHAFELSLFRGFSESFWEWLTEQAEELGYRVG